jgi:hypothetical protein
MNLVDHFGQLCLCIENGAFRLHKDRTSVMMIKYRRWRSNVHIVQSPSNEASETMLGDNSAASSWLSTPPSRSINLLDSSFKRKFPSYRSIIEHSCERFGKTVHHKEKRGAKIHNSDLLLLVLAGTSFPLIFSIFQTLKKRKKSKLSAIINDRLRNMIVLIYDIW